MPIYTRNDLKGRINAGIKGKQDMMVDIGQTMNDAVRDVRGEVDLRSLRRKTVLQGGLFADLYQYPAPVDLDGLKLVSIQLQAQTNPYMPYSLVTYEEFGQQRKIGSVCVSEEDSIRKILMNGGVQQGVTHVISTMDSINSPSGTWIAFGDGENVSTDLGNYVQGSGSIRFDISAAAGLTAGITNLALDDAFDVSNIQQSTDSVFVWFDLANPDEITDLRFRYGIDVANYYEIVATTTHFNTPFASGWNLIRFDIVNQVLTGAVDLTNCTYLAAYMSKEATKVSETNFGLDQIVFASGTLQNVFYYSEYPWIDSVTGAWKLDSTSDNDFINVDSDEYAMMIDKGIELAGDEVDEAQASVNAAARFIKKARKYGMDRPSESMMLTTDYQAQYYI
jgi:hypothetical protein